MAFAGIDTSDLTRYGPYYTGDGRRYLLRLPGDDKAKGRTRTTTFAKTIDDESNLAPWKGTMGIVGVLTDRPTRTEWQALLAEHPDPWYAGPEAKERARELVEQASEAGGAGDRRDTGTALHTILHLIATGRASPDAVDEEWRSHVVNALTVLEQAGLRIVPELCELTVFNRIYDTIGRFDLIVETLDERYGIPAGSLCIADWKTGGATWRPKKDYKTKRQTGWYDGYDMSDGPHVGQLTLYASASDIVVWPENQWDECRLVPMPDVSQTVGFIIHLPSNEPGNVSIRVLDLTIGRKWLDTCRLVRDTRKLKPLVERVGAEMPPVPTTEQPADTQPADPFDGLVDGHVDEPADPARRQWIIGRLETLKTVDGALTRVGQLWPSGLATLKQSDRHTDHDIDRIVVVLDAVEAEFTVSFPVKDPKEKESLATMTEISPRDSTSRRTFSETPKETSPTATSFDSSPISNAPDASSTASSTPDEEIGQWTPSPKPPTQDLSPTPENTSSSPADNSNCTTPSAATTPSPKPTTSSPDSSPPSTPPPDEGGDADPAAVNVLRDTYKALDDGQRAWIAGIARDAQHAGRPIHLQGHATVRRFEIVRGLVALASAGFDDDDVLRALLGYLMKVEPFPTLSVGNVLSALDADGAFTFAAATGGIGNLELAMTVNDDGSLRFQPA